MSAIDSEQQGAALILNSFDAYHSAFRALTRHAAKVFAYRDWGSIPDLTRSRQSTYRTYIGETAEGLRILLGSDVADHAKWRSIKQEFALLITERRSASIIESFFNSVLRKVFRTEGVDPDIEFISFERRVINTGPSEPIYDRFYLGSDEMETMWARILRSYGFRFPFQDFDRDVERISTEIREKIVEKFGRLEEVDQLDMVRSVFYRNKGAYLVGKISKGNVHIPVVLPLLHHEDGAAVDGVLLSKDEIAVVFCGH